MAAVRLYIYRSGLTSACAITGAKDDPRLPPAAPDSWQFWMLIGLLQAEDSRYGFNTQTAMDEIAANGYLLFTGSAKLLGGRRLAPSARGGACDA